MIIFDTNILVSAALLSGSRADLCVRTVLAHPLRLIFSKATYDESADVLMRSKLDRYVSRRTGNITAALRHARSSVSRDATLREEVRDCRDPDDDKFLELALAIGARAIVTGDADLLVLDPWRGIRIVQLTDFEKVVLPLIGSE